MFLAFSDVFSLSQVILLVFYIWLWRDTLSFFISFLSDSSVLKRNPTHWCIIEFPSWQRRSILNPENLLLQQSVKKTLLVKGRVNTYQGNIHKSLTDVALQILSRSKTLPPPIRTKPKFTKVAFHWHIFFTLFWQEVKSLRPDLKGSSKWYCSEQLTYAAKSKSHQSTSCCHLQWEQQVTLYWSEYWIVPGRVPPLHTLNRWKQPRFHKRLLPDFQQHFSTSISSWTHYVHELRTVRSGMLHLWSAV